MTLSYFSLYSFAGGLFPLFYFLSRQTWVVDRLSTCLPPPPPPNFFFNRCPSAPPTTQSPPSPSFPPLDRVPVRHGDRFYNRHKGPKGPTLLGLQLHLPFPPLIALPLHFFPFPPILVRGTHDAPPPDRSHVYPPNFPPFSDGDIAIRKIPPRTLRSLTDPDYAQLPAIALAIGRFVFRGCDCLKLGWATRESEREIERTREARDTQTSGSVP